MYILAVCFTALVGITLTSSAAIAKQLDAWQVLPHPQHFTELYFDDDQHLPAAVRLGSHQKIVFVIHNVEHQLVKYRYKLVAIAAENNAAQSLGSGEVVLDGDQHQTVSRTVTIPSVGARTALKVELEYQRGEAAVQNQSIQYWVKVVGLGL